MVISGFCDLDLDHQTDNLGILSRYFNNVRLESIFLKEEAIYNRIKEIGLRILSIFPI